MLKFPTRHVPGLILHLSSGVLVLHLRATPRNDATGTLRFALAFAFVFILGKPANSARDDLCLTSTNHDSNGLNSLSGSLNGLLLRAPVHGSPNTYSGICFAKVFI